LGEFAPDDWLSPEDVRRITTDNTSLRARNEQLQESLSASTSEVTRLQGVIHDNTSLRVRNQELQESLSASTSEVTRLQGVIDNQEQVRASLDREMYNINLANQARDYESKLKAMQETNAQLAKEIERLEIRKKNFVDPYIQENTRLTRENTALSARIKEQHETKKTGWSDDLVDPYIQNNIRLRQENMALNARIKALETKQTDGSDGLGPRYIQDNMRLRQENTALSAQNKELHADNSRIRQENTALSAQIEELHARAKGLVDPYIEENMHRRRENTALSAQIRELHAEYAVREKRLSDRNAALSAMVQHLRSTESLYETCNLLRREVSALKAANEELLLFRQAHSGPPRLIQRSSRVRKAVALAHKLFLHRRTRAPRLRGGSAVLKRGAQAAGTPRNSLGVVPALSYCVPREQKQTGQTQVSLSLVGHGRRFGGIRSR
jgi:regulator of replication initiation timing